MKRIKNWVLGGIQSKVVNLILYTVILLTGAFVVVSTLQSNMLSRLSYDSNRRQNESIGTITGELMDDVVKQSLERSNLSDAEVAGTLFQAAARRVTFVANYATEMFAHPEKFKNLPYQEPRLEDEGKWTAKVIYAAGIDKEREALVEKLGFLANITEVMISYCPAMEATTMYIGIPEGAHFTVSQDSANWFMDGKLRTYDPRGRVWYQKAIREGRLVFTEGEIDASTGVYCTECAMPVYGPDGTLEAVVGTDLYLTEMEQALSWHTVEGEYSLLVNNNGYAVLEPQAEVFPMEDTDQKRDLRNSRTKLLAQVVTEALQGKRVEVLLGELYGGNYYVTASPIPVTGWVLISAYSEELAAKPITLLQEGNAAIYAQTVAAYQKQKKGFQRKAIWLLVGVTILTLWGALLLGKRIVKPLNIITKRISELKEGNLEFQMEDVYKTGDEVEELAQSFAAISHKTVSYMNTVVQITAEKERIGTELSLANEIQAAMLPHIFPAFPQRKDFDIYASMRPAKEVGGDFYDYFLVDDDHLCLVMADVSGKGVPAALFMMATKILVQSVAMQGYSPAETLTKANNAICPNNEAEMFVTMWLGILELSTGKLTAANAGHEYPILKRVDEPYELYKDKHDFVIGGLEGARYRQYEVQMEPGMMLFVYTDGLAEASNAADELFGTDRILEALNRKLDAGPKEVLDNVYQAVEDFVQEAEQFDDLTMLCMEYIGTPGKIEQKSEEA